MTRTTVNRAERLSQVLSVRLTEGQAKRLQRTLRNFGIHGSSPSEQLRILLRKVHWRSVEHAKRRRERRRLARLKEERLRREAEEEAKVKAFETADHAEWLKSLGEEEAF